MVIAAGLKEHGFTKVRTATLDEPDNGLSDEVLGRNRRADLVGTYGARRGRLTRPSTVSRSVCWQGMGLIVLHSGHFSKIFKR